MVMSSPPKPEPPPLGAATRLPISSCSRSCARTRIFQESARPQTHSESGHDGIHMTLGHESCSYCLTRTSQLSCVINKQKQTSRRPRSTLPSPAEVKVERRINCLSFFSAVFGTVPAVRVSVRRWSAGEAAGANAVGGDEEASDVKRTRTRSITARQPPPCTQLYRLLRCTCRSGTISKSRIEAKYVAYVPPCNAVLFFFCLPAPRVCCSLRPPL